MIPIGRSIGVIFVDVSFDAKSLLNDFVSEDEIISQFFTTRLNSSYFDADSFIAKYKNTAEPIMLSINIQSLNSKFNTLKAFVCNVLDSGTPIDLIILQETWELKFPSQLRIPGFQSLSFRTRDKGRGGGCGDLCKGGTEFQGTS